MHFTHAQLMRIIRCTAFRSVGFLQRMAARHITALETRVRDHITDNHIRETATDEDDDNGEVQSASLMVAPLMIVAMSRHHTICARSQPSIEYPVVLHCMRTGDRDR